MLKYAFRHVVNEYRQQREAAPEVDAVDAFRWSRHVPPPRFHRSPPINSHYTLTGGQNATILGPSHGVVAKAPWLAAIAAGVGTRRQRHKARNLLIKTTERERSSSLCDSSPKEP
jgi:hypothetical protein